MCESVVQPLGRPRGRAVFNASLRRTGPTRQFGMRHCGTGNRKSRGRLHAEQQHGRTEMHSKRDLNQTIQTGGLVPAMVTLGPKSNSTGPLSWPGPVELV
ncbi:unnamed protein product [Protopolystoma xenopodis]|uniref:Uncharacterized protein n=1 Tax=Protopolystoma xenopodis TaxID=117903 RepID=A0A3S5B8I4_9PLAT|nr:unnamed protein product [Protopolystoma xenopodis]